MENIYDKHQELFHYTTSHGLKGILESRTLFATHYKSLNDLTEVVSLKAAISPYVIPFAVSELLVLQKNAPHEIRSHIDKLGGAENVGAEATAEALDVLYRVTFEGKSGKTHRQAFAEPYFTSFCAHSLESYEFENGLLSQWRGYGRDAGYAIVLKTKPLWELAEKEASQYSYSSASLGDVVYEGQTSLFEAEFADLIKKLKDYIPQIITGAKPDLSPLYNPFINSTCRYKNAGFSEENEVRLTVTTIPEMYVAPEAKRPQKPIHFKPDFGAYLRLFEGFDEPLPISRIIVGPDRHKEHRRSKLLKFLEMRGEEIEVVCSATPFSGG